MQPQQPHKKRQRERETVCVCMREKREGEGEMWIYEIPHFSLYQVRCIKEGGRKEGRKGPSVSG